MRCVAEIWGTCRFEGITAIIKTVDYSQAKYNCAFFLSLPLTSITGPVYVWQRKSNVQSDLLFSPLCRGATDKTRGCLVKAYVVPPP